MMNPATYFREAERIEVSETARMLPTQKPCSIAGRRPAYTREQIQGGCILYTMTRRQVPR